MSLDLFGAATRRWFEQALGEPTAVQVAGWAHLARGEHALLTAPTGSGKTLAAFLSCIDRLGSPPRDAATEAEERARGVRVLYVSPLKALVHDIERNLRAPLAGIARTAEGLGETFRAPRVAVRTGDTPQKERQAQASDPAEILVTTPESLYLILGSAQRATLATVDTIIIDEIHALAPTKRGAHLMLSLERVAAACAVDPRRVGLSATARPLATIARFLGGDRPVAIADCSEPPRIDLVLSVPVADMERPDPPAPSGLGPAAPNGATEAGETDGGETDGGETAPGGPVVRGAARTRAHAPRGARTGSAGGRPTSILAEIAQTDRPPPPQAGLWPAIHESLLALIRAHRSTIVFVNSRGLCERLCQRLNELAEEPLARAHHGSVSHDKRRDIEEALKRGALRAIIATSSLELGIDMGAVDLVVLVESPGSVARGLQRIGRAGHHVGEVSKGRILPKHRGDLLEATVVAGRMRAGEVEAITYPTNPLDVLAQQIVAIAAAEPTTVARLEALVRRTASFASLGRDVLAGVLDMLSGRYPSTDFADLRPRLVWDRERDTVEARRGAGRIALLGGGTIPDRGLYGVHLEADGARIGELDEEMVHETRPGQTITLGASTWRVTRITRDQVIVRPAPGEVGRLPFWRGEGPGRPIELGRALGAFVRELGDRLATGDARAWLERERGLDAHAAGNLAGYVAEQRDATGTLPTDRAITVERFRDELGDERVCLLTPFGARVHAPWALAIEARLGTAAGFDVQTLWSDDGIVVRFAGGEAETARDVLFPDPEELRDLIVDQLSHSALFASHFRENASRALLIPRRRPGQRTPLWAQRLKAQHLLAVTRAFPAFPIVLETYRSCMQDVFDLAALEALLRAVRAREIRVDEVETQSASPFARSLAYAYAAAYIYEGDAPLAERRAHALTLDRGLLRELLGEDEVRSLLDPEVIAETEDELQGRAPGYRARHADALEDLLRRIGDLSPAEVAERVEAPDALERASELDATSEPTSGSDAGAPEVAEPEPAAGSGAEPASELDAASEPTAGSDAASPEVTELEPTATSGAASPEVAAAAAASAPMRHRRTAREAQASAAGAPHGGSHPWIEELTRRGRVRPIRLAGEERWIVVEDAALYRDALGTVPPPGLAEALLAPVERPLEQLVRRYARAHGPFTARAIAGRFGLVPGQVLATLDQLSAEGALVPGPHVPGGTEPDWCEPRVLERLKRRTLARLRHEVAPVEASALGRFLPRWHGLDRPARAAERLDHALDQLEGAALSFTELEQRILPARVSDFRPEMLDERGALGEVVWVGSGALGERDGRIALFRRDRIALLLEPPEVPVDASPEERAILDHLEARGACFFAEIERTVLAMSAAAGSEDRLGSDAPSTADTPPGAVPAHRDRTSSGSASRSGATGHAGRAARLRSSPMAGALGPERRPAEGGRDRGSRDMADRDAREGIVDALWSLVWRGLITNDTFQPLRALDAPATARQRQKILLRRTAGRWSLVSALLDRDVEPTRRSHARALLLLERYGLVSRAAAHAEAIPGGFSALYPVLREMEDLGKLRRGHFVDGLGGAQFAYAGAVDRLRAARGEEDARAIVVAATDPANPYGVLLDWPAPRSPASPPPRRAAGAAVVLQDGEPIFYLERGGKRLTTFPAADEPVRARAAAEALRDLAARRPKRFLRIEQIDGEPAARSSLRPVLTEIGFVEDLKGLTLEARRSS